MPTRPYLVMPDGECIPLEGNWRVVELRGEWYILGHDSVVPCGSQKVAASTLAKLESRTDADRLASEAIEDLEPVPLSISGERVEGP